MTMERELLLLALNPTAAAWTAPRIRDLAGSTPNWDELLWDTHWHQTTCALWRALRDHAGGLVPSSVADRLRRHARATATCALHQLQLLRKASRCLAAIDIPSASGRGPLLAQAYYGDAAARDLESVSDLLLLPVDLDRATRALHTAGFVLHPGDGLQRVDLRLRAHVSRHAGADVDRPMLERSRSVVPDLRILETADLLVVLAASLAVRPWGRAQRPADFVAVLQGATASEIEGALSRARAAHLETPMRVALALAANLPGSAWGPPPAIDPELLEVSCRLLRGLERMTPADLQTHRGRVATTAESAPSEAAGEWTGDLGEFVANDVRIVDAMLDLAGARSTDVLYDLGCGDGGVLVRAAQRHGLRAIGIEWDPARVEEARRRVREAGVSALVEVRQGDVDAADMSDATVVYTYLRDVPTTLLPRLRRDLTAGTRLVSRDFDYGAWPPERTEVMPLEFLVPPVWLFRWSIGSA